MMRKYESCYSKTGEKVLISQFKPNIERFLFNSQPEKVKLNETCMSNVDLKETQIYAKSMQVSMS